MPCCLGGVDVRVRRCGSGCGVYALFRPASDSTSGLPTKRLSECSLCDSSLQACAGLRRWPEHLLGVVIGIELLVRAVGRVVFLLSRSACASFRSGSFHGVDVVKPGSALNAGACAVAVVWSFVSPPAFSRHVFRNRGRDFSLRKVLWRDLAASFASSCAWSSV
jgi:hypothetical protein